MQEENQLFLHIIDRKTAKENGLKYYYTGEPCKRGHISVRCVAKFACRVCRNLDSRKWKSENSEKVKTYRNKWHKENKERHCFTSLRWKKNNPGKVREYRNKNKSKYTFYASMRRSKLKDQSPELTVEENTRIENLYYRAWCYSQVEVWTFHVDHIIPITKGGLHHPDNLQIIEATLNSLKSFTHPDDLEEKYLNGARG